MASIITHGIVGATMSAAYTLVIEPMPRRFWILAIALAILPDADALGFMLGVPYESLFGHRGFTHSLFFAVVAGLLTTRLAFRSVPVFSWQWWRIAFFFTLATASHPTLDAMTTGGLGVAWFSPFALERSFFPVRPIRVSPIGVKAFFSTWGLRVILSEFLWVWLPCLLSFLGLRWFARRGQQSHSNQALQEQEP